MRIGVLQNDLRVRATLRSTLCGNRRSSVDLRFADGWDELLAGAGSGSFDVVVVEPWDDDLQALDWKRLARLKDFLGKGGVIAYTSSDSWLAKAYTEWPAAKIPLLTYGVNDDAGRIMAASASAATWVFLLRPLEDELRARVFRRSSVEFALQLLAPETAHFGIEALAGKLRVCDRELRRRSARHGLPQPRALQRWSRILLALGLGRIGVTQGARIARHLGYEDVSSVYRLFRDLVNRGPSDVLGHVDEEENVRRRFLSGL